MGETIGDVVRRERERRGLSARALSLSAGLSPSYVSKLEAGEIDPSVKAFARIARALNLNPMEVFVCVSLEASHSEGSSRTVPTVPSPA